MEQSKTQISAITSNEPNRKYIVPLALILLSVTLGGGVMINKLVVIGNFYVQGGAIVSPFWFALIDVITEVYGYRLSRQILWCCFLSQFIFSFICFLVMHLPSPDFWQGEKSFDFVFGNILRVYFSGLSALIFAGFFNSYLISKWKILVLGKYFWLRNIGSSLGSEIIYSFLTALLIAFGNLPLNKILVIVSASYMLKVAYALVLALPANLLVVFLKKKEGVDVYDYNVDFNPFKLT